MTTEDRVLCRNHKKRQSLIESLFFTCQWQHAVMHSSLDVKEKIVLITLSTETDEGGEARGDYPQCLANVTGYEESEVSRILAQAELNGWISYEEQNPEFEDGFRAWQLEDPPPQNASLSASEPVFEMRE